MVTLMSMPCLCRYDVYANLEAEAAYLKLNDNGVYLLQLQAAFAKLQVLYLTSSTDISLFQCFYAPYSCAILISTYGSEGNLFIMACWACCMPATSIVMTDSRLTRQHAKII